MVECKVECGGESWWLRHLGGHSSGFEFGFNGAGPGDLAYSLLADALGEANEKAQSVDTLSHKLYQQFRSDVLARVPSKENEVEYTEDFLIFWIQTKVKVERGNLDVYKSERNRAAEAQDKLTKLQERYSEGKIEENLDRQISRESARLIKIINQYETFLEDSYIKG